ncbi:asparagine synthase (glutamine-hydrolyzing) [Candidatus Daviesbacteria bacterium RIFCSPLOWO2_02_FULL_36_7]|uniref:asparagine synthase (glutamine-hydrolyzing) n=1 Tax=Candidatus Daviesbacteria bacterium RIFCSPLOWO2_02_FULL_36_7 TaxID=1797792 RepID=A0A1F5MHU8_9BACT|nr:MAG: asparagine synthase (glutamine-hydrolyzing) [Candidatus Daviesbacteria bacterium RIFCSPLOWO2_02_FULL_36_7]
MCGIVGYSGFTNKVSLNRAVSAIKHRGPDDDGTAYFEATALGNTRLAIIDLSSSGHQPMFNGDRSLCITFNGEIYNFSSVKKVLEGKYSFRSNSDTEVILHAYEEWGFKCLDKLNGMFSFVIYDNKKKLLFGARDRLGQKPLKYYFKNGMFIFASEIKAILALLPFKPKIDEKAIDNFLTLQYVPSPQSGFKNIYKLPPAHYFVYQRNKLSVRKYWSLDFNKKEEHSPREWEDIVFQEIRRSVKSHLVSDVPVGVLLSGGLDSSVIVALMTQFTSQKINTFSIGFTDKKFDETSYARIVSNIFKTKHTELLVKAEDLINNIEDIVNIYDEPIADNSILPMLMLAKLASSKVKVALTGDGGDENFAGYDRYTIVNLSKRFSQLPYPLQIFLRFTAQLTFKSYPTKQTERMTRFFSTLDQPFYKKYANYNAFFTNAVKRTLYSSDFKKIIDDNDTFEIYKSLFDPKLNQLDNALKIDINSYLPDDLLYKSDSASMVYGLELRSPFLDHFLMERIAAIPSDLKLKFLTKKKILKDIAYKNNLLPKKIISRQKHGFNIPQNKWFKDPLKGYIYNTIMSSQISGRIFKKEALELYLNNYFNENLNYDNNIFALLILALWTDKYQ